MNRTNLLLLLIAIFLTSCAEIKPLTISDIENVKLSGIKGISLVVIATFKIKNPNKYGFSVKTSDMDLLMNNSPMGKAKLKNRIRIPRKSDQSYTVEIETNLTQLIFGGLMNMSMISKSGKAKVRLKGDLKVSKFWFIKKKFPVDMEKTVDLGQLE